MFHMGDDPSEHDMEDIDMETQARSSTLGTGGGTDYDDASIRARPTYRWEGLLKDPMHRRRRRRFFSKLGAWFGITPLWTSGMVPQGVALDVKLENGRYILLEDGHDRHPYGTDGIGSVGHILHNPL